MTSLAYPDPNKPPPDPQIWRTNAAFDNGDLLDSSIPDKDSLFRSNPIDPSKENKTPIVAKSLLSAKSPRSEGKPLKLLFKQGIRCPLETQIEKESEEEEEDEDECDVSKIDVEIQEIEKEISRLSSKVEALRVKKAEKESEAVVNRKRKFLGMDLKLNPSEKIERSLSQNRRKSCFPTLQDSRLKKPGLLNVQEFDAEKVTTQRGGRSLSLSPKSRKTLALKRGSTTLGPKKSAKEYGTGAVSSVQPKKLFDGRTSVGCGKPIQNGRVIASRYSQISTRRKWSLPSEGIVEKCDRKCSPLVENSRGFLQDLDLNQVTGIRRIKKRWEIPNEVVIHESKGEGESPPPQPSFSKMVDVLPKIKTNRCAKGSPRDSGPAKRVVELVGRKSYFGTESRESNSSVCQALRFDGEK